MDRVTIAEAATALDELREALCNAYWEVSDITHKDELFDVISTLYEESNELAKLSVEDHYMGYETITFGFRNATRKLKKLQANLEDWVLRHRTAVQLEHCLPRVAAMVSDQALK